MELTPSLVGIIGFVALFVLIFLKFPISFAFLLIGFFGIFYFSNFKAAAGAAAITMWNYSTSYILMAVPLFMLMGQFASHSGIGRELYDTASRWLGRLPGGLAVATTWGAAGFAACTGEATGGILTFGPIAYQPLREKKYDKPLIFGTICCGATMGTMIPPSITFIIYASITDESVGKLFMGGVIPGVIEATLYSLAIIFLTKSGIWNGPPGGAFTWKERLISLKGVWGMLTLFILVIGGIYAGIFTPTEGAAIGAFGSLVILIIKKGFSWTPIRSSLMESLRTACMVYFIVIGSMLFARFMALSGLTTMLVETVVSFDVPHLFVIGLTVVMYILLGSIMPAMPMVVLTVPFLYPIFTQVYGYSGIWFGVVVVALMELAFITPPVGINLFVTQSLFGKEAPTTDIYKGVIPFVLSDVVRLVLLVLFPALSLWLPGLMYSQ